MPAIEIVPYNAKWPDMYRQVQQRLQSALKDLALSIDHIGSTAVPNLGSKNRIDVQVTVADISPETQSRLDSLLPLQGFPRCRRSSDHRPPGDTSPDSKWEKLYLSGEIAALPFRSNVHIRARGFPNQVYPILFRDYLRAHSESAMAYYQLKRTLASYFPDNVDAYVNSKDPACDLIMVSAREWAERTGWVAP